MLLEGEPGIGKTRLIEADDPDRAAIAALVDTHGAVDDVSPGSAANPSLHYQVTEAFGALVESASVPDAVDARAADVAG